jgi:hypothetical protein
VVGGLHTVKSYLYLGNSTWYKTGGRHQQSINILHDSGVKTKVIVRQSVAMQWAIIKFPSINFITIVIRIRGKSRCYKSAVWTSFPILYFGNRGFNVVRQVGLAHKAESLISPHAWERSEVRAAEKLVRVFSFPILVCFAEDIKWRFIGGGDFSRSKSIRAIVAKGREWECVATVEKPSEEAAEFTMGANRDGDERVVTVNDFTNDFIS